MGTSDPDGPVTGTAPNRVIIGASSQRYPGWVQTQQDQLDIARWQDWTALFAQGSLTHILAEHVWEHLDLDDARLAACHCFAMLAPGGRVRCAVPDGNFRDQDHQRTVQVGGPGPADHPAASHKVVYTWRTLVAVFEHAGFAVRLLEWCDDDSDFSAEGWDALDGFIYRSARFDHRNRDGQLGFVSLIVDAVKPDSSRGSEPTLHARNRPLGGARAASVQRTGIGSHRLPNAASAALQRAALGLCSRRPDVRRPATAAVPYRSGEAATSRHRRSTTRRPRPA